MTSCCCIDADDPCKLSTKTRRSAAKPHTCGECGRTIPIGARYWYETALSDGHWSTHKTCELCMAVRDDRFECGFYWGRIWDDLYECMRKYGEDDLRVEDLWPDHDWPDVIDEAAVRELIEKCGGITLVIDEWNLSGSVEVWVRPCGAEGSA